LDRLIYFVVEDGLHCKHFDEIFIKKEINAKHQLLEKQKNAVTKQKKKTHYT